MIVEVKIFLFFVCELSFFVLVIEGGVYEYYVCDIYLFDGFCVLKKKLK